MHATDDTAVTDSPGWVIWFAIGVLSALAVVGLIVRLFVWLIRATRPAR